MTFVINRLSRHFRRLDLQMRDILTLCEESTILVFSPRVSGWTVARQLDHLSRVGHDISVGLNRALEEGDFGDRETGRKTTIVGRFLLSFGWFPRGIAQAPKRVVPEENPAAQRLKESFDLLRSSYGALSKQENAIAVSKARMKHPYFGGLTPATWVRFLGVHQHHHLKIIRDILRSNRATSRGSKSSSRRSEVRSGRG